MDSIMVRDSSYRLAWVVCLLLLIGFIGNSISSYYVSRHNVRKTITESSLPLTSDNIYSVIQRDLLQPIFISSMMANDAFLRNWTISGETDINQITRYLSEIKNEFNTVTSFFVSENTRNYYYADGLLKQVFEDEPRDEWYFRVRKMQEPFEINVDPDLANLDAMTIFINYRVFDFEGNYIGATGTGLTVNRVNTLIEEYEKRFGRQIFFCDRNGKVVLRPVSSKFQDYANIREIPGLANHAEALLNEELETLAFSSNGDTFFLNSRFVPELDWFLMIQQTEDVLLAPLRENFLFNMLQAVLVTAIVAFICISAINRHQKKLQLRNQELYQMNTEVERQRMQLEATANELAAANKSLSAMNHEKDDFLGIVAHDLRNPLNGVLGFCEEIRRNLPATETRLHDYLAEIYNSGQDMQELIGDLLNVTTIENFQGPPKVLPCNWNQLCREASTRFQSAAQRKDITLQLQLDDRADSPVPTIHKWIEICLNNLISNAIKYSPNQSRVTIETEIFNNHIELRVRDEGPGLSPEDVSKLFQKFVRLSSRPTAGETSTGLGLYIVRKMCQRLGATVQTETEYRSGSCFIIKHPLGQNSESKAES